MQLLSHAASPEDATNHEFQCSTCVTTKPRAHVKTDQVDQVRDKDGKEVPAAQF